MNVRSAWKYLPPGPILSLTLIGLVLLSALLYYRAVKIQRFLEPALAISQPRYEFTRSINVTFQKEFGAESVRGLTVRMSSIVIHRSLLFSQDDALTPSAKEVLQKLARIFLTLLEDDHTRNNIRFVLVSARYPAGSTRQANAAERMRVQRMVGLIKDSLFQAESELRRRYRTYFAAAALQAYPQEGGSDVIEIRIVPSELLHIEVFKRLEKYAD